MFAINWDKKSSKFSKLFLLFSNIYQNKAHVTKPVCVLASYLTINNIFVI